MRLVGIARETPVYVSESFQRMTGREVWLKTENLQRTGSFKIRGAGNCIATLTEAERAAGVVTASAGNHAQAVAWVAREARDRRDDLHAAGHPALEGRGDAELRSADRARRRDVRRRVRSRLHLRGDDGRDVRPCVRGHPGNRGPGDHRAGARGAAARASARSSSRSAAAGSPRGSHRGQGVEAFGADRRRAGRRVRAVRRRDGARLHDRRGNRGQAARRADVRDRARLGRRHRHRHRRGDQPGDRLAARAREARRRGRRCRDARSAAQRARRRRGSGRSPALRAGTSI